MKSKLTRFVSVFAAAVFVLNATPAAGRDTGMVSSLNLTKEQVGKLGAIIEEFNAKAIDVTDKIDRNFQELEQEVKKEDRLGSEFKAKAAARDSNRRIKKITQLYGDLLKLRVEYLLKAKDVLTERQKAMLISALTEFDMGMPDEFSEYLNLDLTALGLDLTKDQAKKLLKYRSDMDIANIKLNLEMDYKLLDLQDEIQADIRDSNKINRTIIDITEIGIKIMENRVNHTLKAQDVLTVEQNKELLHILMMM